MLRRLATPFANFLQVRLNHNLVSVIEADGVRSITMVDNKTRNCLSLAMMESLINEIQKNDNDKSLRVIVLQSTGPVFSAGHNLKELSHEKGYENQKKVFEKCHELISSVISSPLPVISKIDGLAAGKNYRKFTCSNHSIFFFSCRLATCNIMRHFSLQSEEHVLDPRCIVWNFLQHSRHCYIKSYSSNAFELHASDRFDDEL